MVGVIEQACVYSSAKVKNSKHLKIYLKISFCLWGYLPKVWKGGSFHCHLLGIFSKLYNGFYSNMGHRKWEVLIV